MKLSKNILLFLKLPPPLTGATLMNKFVAESKLLKDNFNIDLIPISYKTKIEDVRIFSFHKIVTIFKLHIRLIAALIKFKPKLIYFQISPLGWAFYRDCTYIVFMKMFRSHIIYHMHGKGVQEYAASSPFRRKLYKWAFKKSSVICLSESLTTDLSNIINYKPYIVNNGIPIVSLASRANNKGNNTIHVLFLSNLIVSKGIFVFLDAIRIFHNKFNGNIIASIVGKETELSREELNSEIEKRSLSQYVNYLGAKYNDEKNEIYQNTDILIYPTYNDVWGLVILEAMQFSIPVIASREGAIPEIVDDGITGFLVDKHSPEQIAEKLELLLKNADLRERMAKAGREKFLEKYTLDIFEKNIIAVFQDIIKKDNEK